MLRRSLLLITIAVFMVSAEDAVIQIDAAKPAGYTIPRTVYGSFLEPIGNSIHGGLWAQVLENPSLEDNLWSATALKAKLDANPALYRASQLGLPIPWEPLDPSQGARYEPRWNDAANSHRSLLLMARRTPRASCPSSRPSQLPDRFSKKHSPPRVFCASNSPPAQPDVEAGMLMSF
jgi:hypothetical protein